MLRRSCFRRFILSTALALLLVTQALPQAARQAPVAAPVKLTSPMDQWGHNFGDDYWLCNYKQLEEYWKKLDRESDRMQLVDIGRTEEGRTQWMAIITSPENHKKLARYKEIARRLALAEDVTTEEQARALAVEGKSVVWIDGGLHATETLGAQQLGELVWQLVSRNDPETLRILNDVIVLCVHANPDGHDLVADWYMREPDPKKRSLAGVPRLYQKYIGHDNNRDFYMSAMAESTNMNRQLYHEWFPQIMYNHHQTGPTGTVLFAPPFRDPFNYQYDPLIITGLDLVGAAMHNRFASENKPGATMRRGANYSTWFNGGLRTTTYFHNMIGLLTETIGSPTPMEIPFVPNRMQRQGDYPFPIMPQKWHFRQSVEYSITANRAVLDVASRYREVFLFNIWRMGRNSIERGSKDTWNDTPSRVEKIRAAIARDRTVQGSPDAGRRSAAAGPGSLVAPAKYYEMLREPAARDPRGYILPATQRDFPTAVKFINALIKNGVTVHRATRDFTVHGKQYPAGSYVVMAAQAFRPHVLDMFEPQDHPNDFQYPGGPPIPPYDNAGYTLAYQMGVEFDRILDGFEGPFEKVSGLQKPPAGHVDPSTSGWTLSHNWNDSFIAVNRLLKAGEDVHWMMDSGGFYIAPKTGTKALLDRAAADLGVSFRAASGKPSGALQKLRQPRIALWDRYGGSMPSGWIRWMFEQYEFPFEVVYPKTFDSGNLASKYDVIVFPDGAIPAMRGAGAPGGGEGFFGREPDANSIPEQFRGWLGSITADKTIPQLKAFLEAGGTIATIGGSNSLAYHLQLPLKNHLTEKTASGEDRPLPRDKFYAPGSVLWASVNTRHPLAHGLPEKLDLFFDNSPVFRLGPDSVNSGITPVAWFSSPSPLRSGWAWGQHLLEGGVAVAEAKVGKGRLFLFGPEITNRAQPHGTFKFLFNGIFYGTAMADRLSAPGSE